jgi:transcriptional regulator with XRE-family HTH domain
MARSALDWSIDETARRTGLAPRTIIVFENGQSSPRPETLQALQRVYEDAGVVFSRRGGEGVILKDKP